MSDASFVQFCLLAGVFVPLASFVFLVFFGTKLGGRRSLTPPRIKLDTRQVIRVVTARRMITASRPVPPRANRPPAGSLPPLSASPC